MDPRLREAVLRRDQCCVLLRLDPAHFCRTIWGEYHDPRDLDKLTIGHVHVTGSMIGKRAPDTLETMVAMCGFANVAPAYMALAEAMHDESDLCNANYFVVFDECAMREEDIQNAVKVLVALRSLDWMLVREPVGSMRLGL